MRIWTRELRLVVLSLVLITGCGSDGGSQPGDTGGGGDSGSDAGADLGADSPTGDTAQDLGDTRVDAGDEPTPDVEGGEAIAGGVTVFEVRAPAIEALRTGGIAAGFAAPNTNVPNPIATFGDCIVTEVDPDASLFPEGPSLDAGDITVELGDETFTLSLEPGDNGDAYVSDAPEDRIEFFTAGLTIGFEAAGGDDLPAFAGIVSSPAEPVISNPAWTGTTGGEHDADEDLAVEWTSTGLGDALINVLPIEILPEPGIADGNAITCTVADSGSTTIPSAALDMLPGGGVFGPNVAVTVVVPINNVLNPTADIEVTLNATASHTIVGAIR